MATPVEPTIEVKLAATDKAMSWLDWSSSVIHSLAWPVAAVVIALIFRRQLAALFDKIRKLTWGDKSVDFSEKLDELEAAARQETPRDAAEQKERDPAWVERFRDLVAISPDAAILDAWKPIEMLVDELSDDYSLDSRKMPLTDTMRTLLLQGVITPAVFNMLQELRRLRNSAAHVGGTTAADAFRFRDLADEMVDALEKHLQNTPKPTTL